jgi:gamma-glutamylcyclotransferase (GGCT)/AIG2-like uncharacterized protein YtfP
MIKIFSYGTLSEKDVQLKEFGQEFYVEPDIDYLSGWDIIEVKMYGEYFKVAIEGEQSSIIMGAIVHLPESIIPVIDEYEGHEYKRITVKTLTNNDCIMYVKR